MIVIVFAIVGVVLGVAIARRRQGDRFDMAQYGVVYGIIFTLAGLAITIGIHRMLV